MYPVAWGGLKIHTHAFNKVVFEMCIQLVGEDNHDAVRMAMVKLLGNVQKADPSVIMLPIAKNSTEKAIKSLKDIPTNFTQLSKYVLLPNSAKAFKPKLKQNGNKRGGRRGKSSKKEEYLDLQIYP